MQGCTCLAHLDIGRLARVQAGVFVDLSHEGLPGGAVGGDEAGAPAVDVGGRGPDDGPGRVAVAEGLVPAA